MNYYQHHIGDFIRDTARLTDSQSMAYLRMLWLYYETEQPLDTDVDAVAFKIGANASDVHQILRHFFFEHDGKWHHPRCDKEILAFREKSDKAKKSADARWKNANAMRTHTDSNANASKIDANQEPITNNQEPITNNQIKTKTAKPSGLSASDLTAFGVDAQVANDFLAIRKAKKAPLTLTALKGIEHESTKAGITLAQALATCAVRGWAGFNAQWLAERSAGQPFPTKAERIAANNRAALDEWEREVTGLGPDFIDGDFSHATN